MVITPEMESLIQEHRLAATERERVTCEEKIWKLTTAEDRLEFTSRKQILLWSVLGKTESQYIYAKRVNLRDAPDNLWKVSEEQNWALGTTSDMNSAVRKLARTEDISMAEAASRLLSEEVGKVSIRSAASHLDRSRKTKAVKQTGTTKSQWLAMRALIGEIVALQGEHLTDIQRLDLLSVLENDVRQVIAGFSKRLEFYRRRAGGGKQLITRRQVVDACAFLHMNVPRVGQPVDLKLAKTQMRRLVRLEHPDTGTGNTENYNAIMDAYVTLEEYNKQIGGGQ